MDKLLPFHNYIVVNPNGDIRGFQEVEDANAYIMEDFVEKIDRLGDNTEMVYVDHMTEPLQSAVDISRELGVYEGECRIFDLDSLIENIRDSGIFEDEKEELISKLMAKDIKLNVNDYQLDEFIMDTKEMERSF